MTKEKLSEKELKEKKEKLEKEINTLEKLIDASCDSTVFDMLASEVKEEMLSNVKEEQWSIFKANKSRLDTYREMQKILSSQDDLLDKKLKELELITEQLENYQTTIFDAQKAQKKKKS
ncbi:hypothetical protein IJ531_05310 [bacterium]|nr:hypothetical protein [bacterium]